MIRELPSDIQKSFFETIPVELSVIGENDKAIAWNKHDTRLFKQPTSVIWRDVRNCHPEKNLAKVEQLLQEMKDGECDRAQLWIDMSIEESKEKHKVFIQYFTLRDDTGRYLGCLEATQDVTAFPKIKGEKDS
jgi:hypothetical protein